MQEKFEEMRFHGIPVSEGIAIGAPFFLSEEQDQVPEFPISLGEVDEEIERYRRALSFSREDLRRLQSDLTVEGSEDVVTIFDTHIQMLEDPMMTTQMEEKIRRTMRNTESVVNLAMRDCENRFSQIPDPFFQQRMVDVMDLAQRILGHLSDRTRHSVGEIPLDSVVFTRELTPSHSAAARAQHVCAFVSKSGGGHSHAALIARAKGIPYVTSVDIEALQKVPFRQVIVDGQTGEVILNPSTDTLEEYRQKKMASSTHAQVLHKECHYDTETVDGCPARVYVNAGDLEELDTITSCGADGMGLFRTEYLLFKNCNFINSEEAQWKVYREVIQKMGGAPAVIRVFDIGGDKTPEGLKEFCDEENPALGCRGIRYLLRRPDFFKTQLRALLRAGLEGDLRILLPLISDVRELIETHQIIQEAIKDLKQEGIACKENTPLGCMIEVPSAVLICDLLAERCDFVAIGTNDLVQYTLGIDRSHSFMGEFCYPAHPSLIRMIKMVVTECRRLNRQVSICGEIASNPLFTPLLLGLGVTDFSCSPRYVPEIKQTIRKNSLLNTFDLAEQVLQLSSAAEISALLHQWSALSS